ncbi:MAG: hypothetical protein ACLR8Y_03945 [Alistipes indistinctus]
MPDTVPAGSISASGSSSTTSSTDLDRGPTASLFANRSFIAKYLTSYYGSELSGDKISHYVKTLGSRDLGIMGTYTFTETGSAQTLSGPVQRIGNQQSLVEQQDQHNRPRRIRSRGRVRAAASYYNGSAPGMLS